MKIKIKSCTTRFKTLPVYATQGAAGADVKALEPFTLGPGERIKVGLGFAVEVPEGYEIQVRGRSGMASRNGVVVAQGIGTIDSDYRGEIGLILINHDPYETFRAEAGDRVCQLVLCQVERMDFDLVSELSISGRGQGGYGSTGR